MQSTETTLADLLSPNPVIVDSRSTLDEAIGLVHNYRLRHLPVVECDRLVGILSDRDLRLSTCMLHSERRLKTDQGAPVPGPRFVADIMERNVVSASPDDSPASAARTLLESRIGALPIVSDGQVVGIVTETDLLRDFETLCREGRSKDQVRQHMLPMPAEVAPDASLEEAMEAMDPQVRHVIVAENGQMCGILSDRDILMGLSRDMIADAKAQESGALTGDPVSVRCLMSPRVISVESDRSMQSAVATMLGQRFSALPVMLAGLPVGILTQRAVLAHYASVA